MSGNIKEVVIKGTQKREWGSHEAICYACKLGEGVEPCVNYENGVGKEGVGNNCPWFIEEDSQTNCKYINFKENNVDPCICYFCENSNCKQAKCKKCNLTRIYLNKPCCSCSEFKY